MFGRKIPTNPEVCRCENCLAFLKVAIRDVEVPPDLERAIDHELQQITGRFRFDQLDEAIERMQSVIRLAKAANDEVGYVIAKSSGVRMSKLIADRLRAMLGEQPKPAAEPTPAPSSAAGTAAPPATSAAPLNGAGPDLLEACRMALADRFGGDDPCCDRDPITTKLRAAIAKAEGGVA